MTNLIRSILISLAVIFGSMTLPMLNMDSVAYAKGAKTIPVRGYTKKDGTHVNPYLRSPPSPKR
jgi:hypothetical protein